MSYKNQLKSMWPNIWGLFLSACVIIACSDSAEPMRKRIDNTAVEQTDSPGRPVFDSTAVNPPAPWQNDSISN